MTSATGRPTGNLRRRWLYRLCDSSPSGILSLWDASAAPRSLRVWFRRSSASATSSDRGSC